MKAKALVLIVLFVCAPSVYLFGQIDCSTSTNLICQLPVTSSNLTPTGGAAAIAAATAASTSINAAIGTQLTQLPVPSASVGTVTLKKKGSDVGVPFANLGPVLTDRPDTVGKGHIFMGFSYQHFNFNAIDGVDLGTFPVAYTFSPTPVSGDQLTYFGSITNNIKFSLDQYVALMTIGLTKTTDISVIVPVSQVTLDVVASNFQTYIYDSQQKNYSKFVSPGVTVTTNGTATGIGDVTINFKQLLIGAEGSRAAVAAGAQLRVPSGDELNYLGSGALGGNAYGLFEFRARLAPHFKISYQWNNVSKLVNPTAGTNNRLPGGLSYAAGADLQVFRSLTLAADILGSQFVNTPSLAAAPLVLTPTPGATSVAPASLPGLNALTTTYTTSNISTGLKWSPFAHLVLYGNVLLQINNVGLRSDPVPLFGISYNFKAKK